VLDTEDLQVVAHRKAISGQIHPVGFSADGTSLVAVEFGNKISQWNIDTWQLITRAESGLDFRYFKKARYAIPQRSDVLLCVSKDSDLVWWDLVHSKELARVDVKSRGFRNEFAVSPTESLLASIAEGDFISLWDWKTRQPAGKVRGPRDFHSVAFSPDGRRLVSGSSGKGALRLWDISTWQEIARLDADVTRMLTSIQFSPDGNMICAIDTEHRASFLRAPSWESINAIEAKHQTERR
jgi:WD40 repeat protein